MNIKRNVGEFYSDNIPGADNSSVTIEKNEFGEKYLSFYLSDNSLEFLHKVVQWAQKLDEDPGIACQECGAKKPTIYQFEILWNDGNKTIIEGQDPEHGRDAAALMNTLKKMDVKLNDIKSFRIL